MAAVSLKKLKHDTMKKIAIHLSLRNTGKRDVNVADTTEMLAHLSDLIYQDPQVLVTLIKNGERRARKAT